MRTGFAVWTSILIAFLILSVGVVAYIVYGEVQQHAADDIPNPLMEADFVRQDVIDENGGISGQRGYIEIPADELTITVSQLKEFADQYVRDSNLLWVSIMTPDGTGFYFPESKYEYAEYGLLTADGQTSALYTTFTLRDGTYEYQNTGDVRASLMNETKREAYTKGIIIDRTTYENDWMGIRFTAPDGYELLLDEEMEDYEEFMTAFISEIVDVEEIKAKYYMLAEDTYEMICGSSLDSSNINFTSGQMPDPSIPIAQYIEASKQVTQEMQELGVYCQFDDVTEKVTIAGHEFTRFHATLTTVVEGNEDISYSDTYYTQVDDMIFSINLTYDEPAEAAGLINAFQAK